MAKKKVIIAGSVAFDCIKTHRASANKVVGGSASYATIAASFFAKPSLIAAVGTDFTQKHSALFEKRGVDLSSLQIKKGKTFVWAASYDKDFKNATTLKTELNVFADFKPVLNARDKKADALFLANIAPELQLSIIDQMPKRPQLIACDTMNYWITNTPAALKKLIKRVDILFLNEAETRQLTGTYNLIKAGRGILKQGPQAVIIKLGPNGAMLVTKDGLCQVPPYLMETITDTTGAGDSFGGGFTGFLASVKNWRDIENLKRAMAVGTVMASFAIESFSVNRLAALTDKDIAVRLKEYIASTRL